MANPLGLTVTVEDFDDQALQLSWEPDCAPEIRESSDGSTEIVLTFEALTYALSSAIEALDNYED
jgi:hypothetical protein